MLFCSLWHGPTSRRGWCIFIRTIKKRRRSSPFTTLFHKGTLMLLELCVSAPRTVQGSDILILNMNFLYLLGVCNISLEQGKLLSAFILEKYFEDG